MILFLSSISFFLGLILFAYFSWRKIEMGIYAVIFFSPLYLARLDIFGIPSTALELGIYILFIIWLAKNYRQFRLNEIISDRLLRIGIFLLLAGALISTFFSSELKISAGILKGWFFDPFLFFVILASEIKTFSQKENILKVFFFSGLAVSSASLLYWFFPETKGITYDGRLQSFYLSPNYLAMYLSPALIAGIWMFYSFKSNKSFWLISSIIIAAAIYFTYSYSAWLSLFISFAALTYYFFKKSSSRKKVCIFAIFCLLFGLAIFSQTENDKFNVLKNLAYRSSYNSRLMIWQSAWEIGKDNWLIGIGPGNFQKYYLDYQAKFTEPYLEWAVPQPHNIFLAFWLETGILGFLGFILILAWFLRRSFNLLKNNLLDREYFLLSVVLLSLMIYTLIHGLFDTTYWKNDLAMIFWLNLALLVSIKK